jgi:hypothetical protein
MYVFRRHLHDLPKLCMETVTFSINPLNSAALPPLRAGSYTLACRDLELEKHSGSIQNKIIKFFSSFNIWH